MNLVLVFVLVLVHHHHHHTKTRVRINQSINQSGRIVVPLRYLFIQLTEYGRIQSKWLGNSFHILVIFCVLT